MKLLGVFRERGEHKYTTLMYTRENYLCERSAKMIGAFHIEDGDKRFRACLITQKLISFS